MSDPLPPPATEARARRAIAVWLLCCCAAIFVMVVIGGITRLTESGLSMVEWRPVDGFIPPMNQAEWLRVFEMYRQTPEYLQINRGMSLDEFKNIFWWEFIHRVWGRLIGLIFFVPLVVFAVKGRLDRPLGLKLGGILVLGGLQGFVGWWMVTSGLVDRPDVSQYRLALHLGLAILLFCLCLWIALDLLRGPAAGGAHPLRPFAWTVLGFVAATIAAGAFVAGTNAGLVYNTFPLMGGALVPPDYLHLTPGWLNALENPAAIQFNHRVLAIGTTLAILLFWWQAHRADLPRRTRSAVRGLVAMAIVQTGLGIATLLLAVPITLAVLHQAGAVILIAKAVRLVHMLGPHAREAARA